MSDSNEEPLQKLAPSIVEIISDDNEEGNDSRTLGTGFVVSDDGLVVTCRHVVTDSEDMLLNAVWARFYSDFIKATTNNSGSNIDYIPKYSMNLVKEYNRDPSVDLAFFKLDVISLSQRNKD